MGLPRNRDDFRPLGLVISKLICMRRFGRLACPRRPRSTPLLRGTGKVKDPPLDDSRKYRYSVRTSISSLTQSSPFSVTGDTTTERNLRPAAAHWPMSDRQSRSFWPMSARKCPFSTRYPQRLVREGPISVHMCHLASPPLSLAPLPISIERPAVSQRCHPPPPFPLKGIVPPGV